MSDLCMFDFVTIFGSVICAVRSKYNYVV